VFHTSLLSVECGIQEESDDSGDIATQASATLTARSSPHHLNATEHSILTQTSSLEMQAPEGNSISGYEGLDAREVEEARIRSQRPSEYVALPRADNLEDLYSRPIKKKWRSLVKSKKLAIAKRPVTWKWIESDMVALKSVKVYHTWDCNSSNNV